MHLMDILQITGVKHKTDLVQLKLSWVSKITALFLMYYLASLDKPIVKFCLLVRLVKIQRSTLKNELLKIDDLF